MYTMRLSIVYDGRKMLFTHANATLQAGMQILLPLHAARTKSHYEMWNENENQREQHEQNVI